MLTFKAIVQIDANVCGHIILALENCVTIVQITSALFYKAYKVGNGQIRTKAPPMVFEIFWTFWFSPWKL